VSVLADGAGDHAVVQVSHQAVEPVVKQATASWVDETGERFPLTDYVGGVKRDVGIAENLGLELPDGGVPAGRGVFGLDDDSTEHEHRVLGIDDAQAVVAGFVEKEGLHSAIVDGVAGGWQSDNQPSTLTPCPCSQAAESSSLPWTSSPRRGLRESSPIGGQYGIGQ
jgi:hypothetical protein